MAIPPEGRQILPFDPPLIQPRSTKLVVYVGKVSAANFRDPTT
jgi:hypothetical protein